MSTEDINKQINKAIADGRARSQAWIRAGNTGPMPFSPLPELPPNATRAQREMRETVLAMRRRVEDHRAQMEAGRGL